MKLRSVSADDKLYLRGRGYNDPPHPQSGTKMAAHSLEITNFSNTEQREPDRISYYKYNSLAFMITVFKKHTFAVYP